MPRQTRYEKVARDSLEDDEQGYSRPSTTQAFTTSTIILIAGLLLVSNLATALTVWKFATSPGSTNEDIDAPTPYAGLTWDTDTVFGGHDQYTDRNETFRDELWKAINIDDGMVALPHDLAREKGLPMSQPFPWDDSKGIYLLHGYHNLHCTRNIYIALMEYRLGLPQTRNWRHVIHCLDALRRDVICNADDTPRFTTTSSVPETGRNQPRKCRSWDKLEQWAKKYNACYRYINETSSAEEFPQIQRFVWCPKDSPYKEKVEQIFDVEWDHGDLNEGGS